MSCGDFSILSVLKLAIVEAKLEPWNTVIVSGIGCGSKTPHFVRTYGFEGLHGRALPVATGMRIANHKLNVIAVTGDGDGYGIGGNHFIHTARRNLDITHIIQNNEVYGLTKGQTSPTSEKGFKSNSTPQGVLEEPVNPIALAITMGATFVARGYALDIPHLKKLMIEGIKHKGYSVIDVFQPCSTYNKINTPEWYKMRLFKLEEVGHDPADKIKAFEMAQIWGGKIPIGVFYRESKPTYEDGLPQIAEKPLAEHDISNVDISVLLNKFR
ncbi:MAG: 2-oxoacid:ferredoxin oxidoreductase subunit beta [Candidatus Aenigmarchaeota archaeon]|nr:2-oxoacid:ferredoxin oxidoreductase subunit beta [Candidatus Aenigmarchaeota archaeon]